MVHRKLTERERDRMIDIYASGPLSYIREMDDPLFELDLISFYDSTRETEAVEAKHGTDYFFTKNGSVLPEWYGEKPAVENADSIIKERMLRNLKANASRYFYLDDANVILREMYLEDPGDCCVPEAYLGDDVYKNIFDKFYAVMAAIREEIGLCDIEIYIDVSCESDTTVLLLLGEKVLYKCHFKAWNFWWETEDELADYMHAVYLQVIEATASAQNDSTIYSLCLQDIIGEAVEMGIPIEIMTELLKDDDALHYIKKGIGGGLVCWPEVVKEAIRNYLNHRQQMGRCAGIKHN